MTDDERAYPELDELAVPVEPLSRRVTTIETLAGNLADTAEKLKHELVTLGKNLESIVGYLREVNQRMGELTEWRDKAERRIRDLERSDRSRPPSAT
jgi:predicted  nucleic acid-binding Zn-ribbon protein